jgi:hypothetical protein
MYSESVNQRPDNTMTKTKSTKGQTTIYKTYKTIDIVKKNPTKNLAN